MPKRTKAPSRKCKQPTMVCASCGGTDHQRKSSNKCANYRQKEEMETRNEESVKRYIEEEESSDDENE
eukprot:3343786-Ditylum_brightwellii.AAC.1